VRESLREGGTKTVTGATAFRLTVARNRTQSSMQNSLSETKVGHVVTVSFYDEKDVHFRDVIYLHEI
jgi:hypothetical protein